ncbi:20708_t:CDS:2 [Cetraspora pellucida]|uniref:DNA-directed DNA polymerase n=1 Tax=Cetraspora pellucida TaxID=1433469 RepID=A0A9N9BZC5_9GLOM|nr:20708_t:CDS:2 [Cetraspora pellucida]
MHTTTIFDQTARTRTGSFACYDDIKTIAGVLSCNDIVAEFDNGTTPLIQQSLSSKQPIHFMPTKVSNDTEYVNGISTYILHITDTLINGQKAVINITDIKLFFDVEVPEEMLLSMFKTKLVKILSNILNSTSKFGIETISAFSLQGYHTEKKLYIHVRTWNYYNRYNALKAVRAVGMYTASDDLNCQYYYCKVACKERLPLSSWAVLNDYLYEHIQGEVLSSTILKEETRTEKYPGAYVFSPVKGLKNRHPITGLDFASLYLSLIITYNLSSNKIILSQEDAKQSEKGLYVNILEYLSGKQNKMKKCLASLKETKEDIGLVIGLMDKGLSLPEAIEQVLAKAEEKKSEALQLIKKGLTSEPYLYQISEPGEHFEYIVVENNLSQKVGDKMEYPEPSSESIEKSKNGKDLDKDDVLNMKDTLAQKSAKNKVVKCSGNVGYYTSFLNALDKLEESAHLKVLLLLKEISKIDECYKEEMYKLVTKSSKRKSKAMILEKYILSYDLENEYKLLANF